MDEEQYIVSKGYGLSGFGELALTKGNYRTKQGKKIMERQYAINSLYMAKRQALRNEYKMKVRNGELLPTSTIDRLITAAKGNPDNESTKAARRCLQKRGYNINIRDKSKTV